MVMLDAKNNGTCQRIFSECDFGYRSVSPLNLGKASIFDMKKSRDVGIKFCCKK